MQLVEIPTDDEIHDNICAYWLAEKPTRSGDALRFRYRLHWLEAEPGFPVDVLARAVGTRIGRGGQSGKPAPMARPSSAWSSGKPLAQLPSHVLPGR